MGRKQRRRTEVVVSLTQHAVDAGLARGRSDGIVGLLVLEVKSEGELEELHGLLVRVGDKGGLGGNGVVVGGLAIALGLLRVVGNDAVGVRVRRVGGNGCG